MMEPLRTHETLDAAVTRLVAIDARFAPLAARVRPLPLRFAEPGFAALARIVISQQVSASVADVLSKRLEALATVVTPQSWMALGEEGWRAAGLSRPKQKTITAIAKEVEEGRLDPVAVCRLDVADAIAALTSIWGVGPWTAEVYLLFAGGHPDVFPARDLALQIAAKDHLGWLEKPGPEELAASACAWSPLRSVAARVLWAAYGLDRGTAPLPPTG